MQWQARQKRGDGGGWLTLDEGDGDIHQSFLVSALASWSRPRIAEAAQNRDGWRALRRRYPYYLIGRGSSGVGCSHTGRLSQDRGSGTDRLLTELITMPRPTSPSPSSAECASISMARLMAAMAWNLARNSSGFRG